MKSIESLAVEKYISQRDLPPHKQLPANMYIDWAQFGAREAQRWINMNDELPEKGVQVLVKDKRGVCEVDIFINPGWMGNPKNQYTHWRPIERI